MKTTLKTLLLVAISFALAAAPKAIAECGALPTLKPSALFFPQLEEGEAQLRPASLLLVSRQESDDDAIVGFWKVKLISQGTEGIPDGTMIDQGFAAWHSDHTEILNSSRPPATSSFCLGVWKKVSRFRYKLNHFAISSDLNGNLVGPANIREDIAISRDGNSYAGTFTIDQYDQTGNNLHHLQGEVTGTRIKVNTPIGDVL